MSFHHVMFHPSYGGGKMTDFSTEKSLTKLRAAITERDTQIDGLYNMVRSIKSFLDNQDEIVSAKKLVQLSEALTTILKDMPAPPTT